MRKYLLLTLVLLASIFGQAQSTTKPYVFGGLSLNGGGYQAASFNAGVGIDGEYPRLITSLESHYNSAKKVNDGTGQHSGYSVGLDGTAFYKLPQRWSVGGGYHYTWLNTQAYHKRGGWPSVGLGRDLYVSNRFGQTASFRVTGEYLFPYQDKQNGVHGMLFTFWLPSLNKIDQHLFFRERVGIYRFHSTLTDTSNEELTRYQLARRAWTGGSEFTIGWRF
jgi:hypothetical protein